jgi:hypothetical protein
MEGRASIGRATASPAKDAVASRGTVAYIAWYDGTRLHSRATVALAQGSGGGIGLVNLAGTGSPIGPSSLVGS